ncbi:MAG: outer membrane beta-barrel protein [Rhodobacteraceae bacterium]|nr:outer membrane beta-barrel protein [Paracoccaceae bacterium]
MIGPGYVGGIYGISTGGHDYSDIGNTTPYVIYDVDGTYYGGFAGYNFQRNNLVFGAEVAVSAADVQVIDNAFPLYSYDSYIDLKGRIGYSFGNALIYGQIGASFAHWIGPGEEANLAGFNYGAGIDYAISDRIFIGLEYFIRDMSSDDITGLLDTTLQTNTQNIQVRIGFSF